VRREVALVVVSHSARLAAGVAELAREMAGPAVRLVAVGGLAPPEQRLGTNAEAIRQAIEQVYSDAGVVVLMDLGSALLSAELAVDLLPAEWRQHIVLCDAPLVEGAVAAAVQAGLGSPIDRVVAEARRALVQKVEQLQEEPGVGSQASAGEPGLERGRSLDAAPSMDLGRPAPRLGAVPTRSEDVGESRQLRLTVRNRLGLHARPAARLVQTAARFLADVQVSNVDGGRGPASARSITAVTALGVLRGQQVLVSATGPDAEAALAAIVELAEANFGDVEAIHARPDPTPGIASATAADLSEPGASRPKPDSADTPRTLHGQPASPGIALGKAHRWRSARFAVPEHRVDDPAAAWNELLEALEKTRAQIRRAKEAVAGRVGGDAAVFDAHLLFLDDEALLGPARRAIFDDDVNAAAAWYQATLAAAARLRLLDDAYQRARAADVEDVGRQVVSNVLGDEAAAPLVSDEPRILVASDVAASDVARLDPARVLAVCSALGGPTSHGAILLRSLGVPAVVGLGPALLTIDEGAPLIVDGAAGIVEVNPDHPLTEHYARNIEAARETRAAASAARLAAALTGDGHRVVVCANVGSLAEARGALAAGADGIGLFRSEFLFLDRMVAPDEDEQFVAYRAAVEGLRAEAGVGSQGSAGPGAATEQCVEPRHRVSKRAHVETRPFTIRTLDVGGDKPLAYLAADDEANPFLGWRGIRLCLERPEFFQVQLRAIVRVAAMYPLRVMFPMIATIDEFREARGLLMTSWAEISRRGQPVPRSIQTGIMVETPAAALLAARFADEVDFFSIGTNDLAQYTLAADRGNPRVATLADPFHPAVLRLIARVTEAAHARGRPVAVCGEMAGDTLAAPLLIGLGVDELSMAGRSIPEVKQSIRGIDRAAAVALAGRALEAGSPEEVRRLARAG